MDKEQSTTEKLLEDRIIWLNGEVTDESANKICSELMLLAANDSKKDIYLYINSPGGSITAGMAIYDVMQYIQPDIVTISIGLSASMGQFLLSSGAKGKRYAMKHSRILMHQPLGGIGGSATEVKIHTDLLLDMKNTMAELIANQTDKSVEQILKDSDRDHWFKADEAKEYGFVDYVIERESEINKDYVIERES
jgi:ATP-dependent Clp protease protease subunit